MSEIEQVADEKPKRGRKPKRIEVIVMHKTNVQLETADEPGKKPFRWRGNVAREEYELVCALDDDAGRDHRLMKV